MRRLNSTLRRVSTSIGCRNSPLISITDMEFYELVSDLEVLFLTQFWGENEILHFCLNDSTSYNRDWVGVTLECRVNFQPTVNRGKYCWWADMCEFQCRKFIPQPVGLCLSIFTGNLRVKQDENFLFVFTQPALPYLFSVLSSTEEISNFLLTITKWIWVTLKSDKFPSLSQVTFLSFLVAKILMFDWYDNIKSKSRRQCGGSPATGRLN